MNNSSCNYFQIAGAVLLGFGIAAKVNPQSITDSLAKLPQSGNQTK